eukprot:4551541-Alexandrium_andersonii.AAC.1
MRAALAVERFAVQHVPFAGAVLDLWKCFDRLAPQIVECALRRGGFPPTLLRAYVSMQRSLSHRFRLRIGLGRSYHRQQSIPQGDPLSMCIVALITLPWLRLCQAYSAVPRLLADDILLVGHGEHAAAKTAIGLVALLSDV